MINAIRDPPEGALLRWAAIAMNAPPPPPPPPTPSEPRPQSTDPCTVAGESDAARLEGVLHRAPWQPGKDPKAKASGPALIRLFAFCILLSALAAAFATAFATAPHWLPSVVSVWWSY